MGLVFRDLSKHYGAVVAIKKASMEIKQGEVRAILGGNGSGKSTLAKIIGGLDFFRQLAEQGRLDKGEFTLSRIEKGEIGVAIIWDFVGIGYREQIKENNPDADFEICIPEEGSVQSGYTTIINAYTQRPHAAALTREYILSDEGQLNLAKGYAKTVRDIELPADLQAKMIPDEQYQNIRMVEDADAWEQTVAELPTLWNEQVMAYAK